MEDLAEGGCDFCIGGPDGAEGCEFGPILIVRARKEYRCCECSAAIPKGERYERTTGKWNGDIQVFKTCLACAEVREALCCDGWIYTELWDGAADGLFPHLTTGCLAKLKTAAAKEKLLEEWRRWKGLAA